MRTSQTSPAGEPGAGFDRIASIGVPIGAAAAAIAGATIWLVLTDPVTVLTALDDGDAARFLVTLAVAVFDAMSGGLAYL